MPTVKDAIAAGDIALNKLYALQNAAMKQADQAAQTRLQDDIDDLTFKLRQLNGVAIAADDARIAALNSQLDKVTRTATASLTDLTRLTDVLSDVVAAAKMLDGIIGIVAKA